VGAGVTNDVFVPADASQGIHPLVYTYMDPVTNCSNTAHEHITVYPLPEIQFTINPKITFLANSRISFVDYTAGADHWQWDFGDSLQSDDRHGFHIYNDTGYYHVSLIVVDNHGCSSRSSDMVYIGLEFAFNVPNAFTPNGDGKNETFNGVGIGIGKYEMSIFNRWGDRLFTTNDLFRPWNGDGAPEDTYVYKINLEDITGKAYEYVGHVSIVK
jgi:gliding motility-associated-like protein